MPLTALPPDLPTKVLHLRVRTLFSAVHGVVHLALRQEVAALVVALVAGAPARVALPDQALPD